MNLHVWKTLELWVSIALLCQMHSTTSTLRDVFTFCGSHLTIGVATLALKDSLSPMGFFRTKACICDFNLSWEFLKLFVNVCCNKDFEGIFLFLFFLFRNLKISYGIQSEIFYLVGNSCIPLRLFQLILNIVIFEISRKKLLLVQNAHSIKYQSFLIIE